MTFTADPNLIYGCPILLRYRVDSQYSIRGGKRGDKTYVGLGLVPGQYLSLCVSVEKDPPARIELFDGDQIPDRKLKAFSLRKGRDVRRRSAAIGLSNRLRHSHRVGEALCRLWKNAVIGYGGWM